MRFLLKYHVPNEPGNIAVGDPRFGEKIQQLLEDLNAEAVYFSVIDGQRGGYIVVNLDDASQIPLVVEPLFLWFKADVEFIPVMLPEDLAKAGSSIAAAMEKWR